MRSIPRLDVRLFGSFSVERPGRRSAVQLPSRKAQALFAYLASPPGQPRHRGALVDLLWSDVPSGQGRHSLRQALSGLRRWIGPDADRYLVGDGETLALCRETVRVDAHLFDRLLQRGTPRALALACHLYRGHLLEGLQLHEAPFDNWVHVRRSAFRQLAITAFESRVACLASGDRTAAIRVALRLLEIEPLHEPAYRALMKLSAEHNRYAEVRRMYQLCRSTLWEQLGIEPEAETRALFLGALAERPGPAEGRIGASRGLMAAAARRQRFFRCPC